MEACSMTLMEDQQHWWEIDVKLWSVSGAGGLPTNPMILPKTSPSSDLTHTTLSTSGSLLSEHLNTECHSTG